MDADRAEQHPSGDGADAVVLIPSRWSVLLSSAWHWDLQTALVVGAAVGVSLSVVSATPLWWWVIPLLVVSLGHSVLAASEASGLSARLNGTRYGALIHVTDPTEIKFRAPYEITLWVSLASVACCVLAAALFSITDSKTLDIIVSAGTALLVTWSALCLVSLARLFALHEGLVGAVDSMPEVVDQAPRWPHTRHIWLNWLLGEPLESPLWPLEGLWGRFWPSRRCWGLEARSTSYGPL